MARWCGGGGGQVLAKLGLPWRAPTDRETWYTDDEIRAFRAARGSGGEEGGDEVAADAAVGDGREAELEEEEGEGGDDEGDEAWRR